MNLNDYKEILKAIENHEKRIKTLEELFKREDINVTKDLSIREFLNLKNPDSYLDKVIYVGYFLEKYEALGSFTAKDIEKKFREAKEKIPSNINSLINRNIEKGYIMEAEQEKDGLKAWILTHTGERFVENELTK